MKLQICFFQVLTFGGLIYPPSCLTIFWRAPVGLLLIMMSQCVDRERTCLDTQTKKTKTLEVKGYRSSWASMPKEQFVRKASATRIRIVSYI